MATPRLARRLAGLVAGAEIGAIAKRLGGTRHRRSPTEYGAILRLASGLGASRPGPFANGLRRAWRAARGACARGQSAVGIARRSAKRVSKICH
jgi:hypothetical protein